MFHEKWKWVILDVKFNWNIFCQCWDIWRSLCRGCDHFFCHDICLEGSVKSVIHTRATELGNSLSSHYVWCLTLEWKGLWFAKGPSENLLLIKYVRNQMLVSLIIDAGKFSSYCDTIKLSENCLFIKHHRKDCCEASFPKWANEEENRRQNAGICFRIMDIVY